MRLRSLFLAAGLSAVMLAGCGSENDALIPGDDADTLSQLVADAGAAVDAGECDAAHRAAREAEQQLAGLPRKTSRELKQNLREWLEHLDERIGDECSAEPETTETPESTETATPEPTETATPEPTETPSPEPTETPSATETPGTGGEDGPEEPSGSGGVAPQENG